MIDILTILIMQLRDLARVLALEHNLEIPLVEACYCGKPRTRELGQWMQVQAIHERAERVQQERCGEDGGQRGRKRSLGHRVHGFADVRDQPGADSSMVERNHRK
jgi:hypothetical protein